MQKKILDILLNADDFISGQEISEKLGVSRQAVWKAINVLKEKGYEIMPISKILLKGEYYTDVDGKMCPKQSTTASQQYKTETQ